MSDPLLTAIITVIATVLTATIGILANRRKVAADVTAQLTNAASGMLERMQGDIARMQAELIELRPFREKVRDLEYKLQCAITNQEGMQRQLTSAQGRIQTLELENAALRAAQAGA
jgi:signal transduction histidine kinase